MIEIRWHGRGGQGIVVASELLATAAFMEGKWSQAFPHFGAERRGAPVKAFTRISEEPIRLRSQIYTPDIVVIVDPSALSIDTVKGLKKEGLIIANTSSPHRLGDWRLAYVDATGIASKLGLKLAGLPIPNTAMLGAISKASGIVDIKTIVKVIRSRWPGEAGEKNVKAALNAYDKLKFSEL